MGSDILTTFRTSVRAALADTGTNYSNAMIDQAVFSAVSDISRRAPRQQLHLEVLHTRTVTDEAFTSSHGNFVTLANYIDETASVVVKNSAGTITYNDESDGPDFIIDYILGRIQTLSTGNMVDSAAHIITYERSLRHISLSTLTGIIGEPDTVEVSRKGGQDYQTFSGAFTWGDVLILQSREGGSTYTNHPALVEGDRIRVWYNAEHTKPGASASSIPIYMDDIATKGAIAYALFSKHRERQLAAITIRGTASTQLAKADNDQGAIDTLETAITLALDNAKTTLALIDALADTSIADINTALDKVITHNETGTLSADKLLAATVFQGLDAKIAGALAKVQEHLESDATNPDSAENQLKTGDATINAVNLGLDVPALHGRYSELQVQMARGFIEEAAGHIQRKQALIAEIDRKFSMSDGFVDEARERLGIVNALYQTAFGYVQEAAGRQVQIDRHIQLGLLYTDNARGYLELIDRDMGIADRLLIDAQDRHAEYMEHLESKVEMGQTNRRSAAIRQNPENRITNR